MSWFLMMRWGFRFFVILSVADNLRYVDSHVWLYVTVSIGCEVLCVAVIVVGCRLGGWIVEG